MSRQKESKKELINDQFVAVATALGGRFPDLDLRFARESDEQYFIMQAVGVSEQVFEFELGVANISNVINEAILALKVLTREFDD